MIDYTKLLRKYAVDSHNQYDDEPVCYCRDCMSLKIMRVGNMELCDDCGGTDFCQADIHDWELMYKRRYGRYYVEPLNIEE